MYTHQAGRTPVQKNHKIKGRNTIFNEHPVLYYLISVTNHGEESTYCPHHDGHVDAAGGLEDPGRGHKDAAADDAADNDGAPVEQGHLGLEFEALALRPRPRLLSRRLVTTQVQ